MNRTILTIPLFTLLLAAAACAAADDDSGPVRGAELLLPFKKSLMAALQAGLQQGPAAAIGTCRDEAPAIAARLTADGVSVGRSSHKLRNPDNVAPDWVAPILSRWVEDGTDRRPVTVALAGERRGYVEPITVQPMCLVCHGERLPDDVAARISALYPGDRATGFAAGDFRGVFWVEYPQAEAP